MGGLVLLGVGALALFGLASMGGRKRSRVRDRETPRDVCTMAVAAVVRSDRPTMFAWLECDGRTVAQAADLSLRLRNAGRADDSTAVQERWNAIRAVASSPPDGIIQHPEEAEEVQRADRGEGGGSMTMGDVINPNTAEARRLAGPTVRALRRRENYRRPLTDFQRAAGITADGRYSGQSYNALRYYGADPPAPFTGPAPTDAASAYPPGSDPASPQRLPGLS